MAHLDSRLRVVGVIPARWGASRFPGKPVTPIAGRPMIAHVIERARGSALLDEVVVATDDERIADVARDAGARVVLTGEAATGTDRIAQAVRAMGNVDVVVNIQGDEPLIDPAVIDAVVQPFASWEGVQVVTAARPFALDEDPADPNRVKVVVGLDGRALYFSRAPIPFARGRAVAPALHVGIYAFWRAALQRFADLKPTPLEACEGLEQLRLLEHGIPVHVVRVDWRGIAVDVPDDVRLVEERLGSGNL